MFIEDGTGSGNSAQVTDENLLKTLAITRSLENHANQDEGEAYNALFAVNPDGAGDCIFYLKNNSNTDLIIESIWWQTSAAEEVYYKLGDVGVPVLTNGSVITPANLNAGSGNSADCTCYSNTADGATDITGLSGGTTIQQLWLTSAQSTLFNCEADIVLTKNQVFTIYCVGGDTLLRGTLSFHYHDSK